MDNKKQRDVDQRRVVGYLRPALCKKFDAYINANGVTKSEALNEAVRSLMERECSMPKSKNSY
jgi:metal-responsive CopG/Arc/MetJ family transcriptional regulator